MSAANILGELHNALQAKQKKRKRKKRVHSQTVRSQLLRWGNVMKRGEKLILCP